MRVSVPPHLAARPEGPTTRTENTYRDPAAPGCASSVQRLPDHHPLRYTRYRLPGPVPRHVKCPAGLPASRWNSSPRGMLPPQRAAAAGETPIAPAAARIAARGRTLQLQRCFTRSAPRRRRRRTARRDRPGRKSRSYGGIVGGVRGLPRDGRLLARSVPVTRRGGLVAGGRARLARGRRQTGRSHSGVGGRVAGPNTGLHGRGGRRFRPAGGPRYRVRRGATATGAEAVTWRPATNSRNPVAPEENDG